MNKRIAALLAAVAVVAGVGGAAVAQTAATPGERGTWCPERPFTENTDVVCTQRTWPTPETKTVTVQPTSSASSTTPPTTTTSTPPPVNAAGDGRSYWMQMNSIQMSDALIATEAKRRTYVVLNGWEKSAIPKFKAANPNIKVLVYKDLSSTRSYACGNAEIPAGVDYCWANTNRPAWFLTNSSGQRYTYQGYSGHVQMDVGNVDYQNTWATNVINSTREFDGVFADNALFPCDAYHSGSCSPKYPNNTAFQDAYVSMLSNVTPKLNANGKIIVANLSNARLHGDVWNRYMNHLDGGWDEWWLAFSSTNVMPDYAEGWSKQVKEIADNEARGKITWVQPHFDNTDTKTFRYTFASYMMANGSKAAYSHIAQTDGYGNPSPWHGEYDWNLGTATGSYRALGNSIFRRDFACGAVIVNAHASASTTQSLGGVYTNESGGSVSSVTLAAKSGTILRKSC